MRFSLNFIKLNNYKNERVSYISLSIDTEKNYNTILEQTMDIFECFNIGNKTKQNKTILKNTYEYKEDPQNFLDFVTAMPYLNDSIDKIKNRVQRMLA